MWSRILNFYGWEKISHPDRVQQLSKEYYAYIYRDISIIFSIIVLQKWLYSKMKYFTNLTKFIQSENIEESLCLYFLLHFILYLLELIHK